MCILFLHPNYDIISNLIYRIIITTQIPLQQIRILSSQFFYQLDMGCEHSAVVYDADLIRERVRKPFKKERLNVAPPNEFIFENVRSFDLVKSEQDLQFIERILSSHFLLYKLAKQEKRFLAGAMIGYESEENKYVFEQGSEASMFFILVKGRVKVEINHKFVRELERGGCFGDLALIYATTRSASVKTIQSCRFWCLSRKLFTTNLEQMVKKNYNNARGHVSKLPLFNCLTPKQSAAISYNAHDLRYEKGDVIFIYGDEAHAFYIIVEGSVKIDIPNKQSIILKAGESFGEGCLSQHLLRSGKAECIEQTNLLAISRDDLKACIGGKSGEDLVLQNTLKWGLRRTAVFSKLSPYNQKRMVDLGNIQKCRSGQILIRTNDRCDRIYMSLEKEINEFGPGEIIFAEHAYNREIDFFTSPKNLIKQGDGHVYWISLTNVHRIMSYMSPNEAKVQGESPLIEQVDKPEKPVVVFENLTLIKKLGQGQFGTVYLVQDQKTQTKFALKSIEKNHVVKNKLQKFVKSQRQNLKAINFPFIVKHKGSYKDGYYVHFLMNYIQGGDFFDVLRDIGVFSLAPARFYAACILLCIQYLHSNKYVYRDLKPQNAAIDDKGYLFLIDLGTAKKLAVDKDLNSRTFTIIGTPHYMAPEIIQGKGYSFEVDLWSFGVIVYEMMCNKLPFGNDLEDPTEIYKQIDKKDVCFPRWFSDIPSQELIKRLLQRRPEMRAMEDFDEIKSMKFFNNFSWKLLEAQGMESPYNPKINAQQQMHFKQPLMPYLNKQKEKFKKQIQSKESDWEDDFVQIIHQFGT